MDYKRLKDRTNAENREKKLWVTVIIMAVIIAVQTAAIVYIMSNVNNYKAMYDEALNERLAMQQKINTLTGTGDVSANYSDSDDVSAGEAGVDADEENEDDSNDENSSAEKKDIPFVTEGKELKDESGSDN